MANININLVGPMGAGKTTIGRRLAKVLGRPFRDSDKVITERTGVDIPLIFELEGEAGFRKREAAIIKELTREDGIVLATGGGAVIDANNRDNLNQRGITVYLNTTVEQQLQRTARDKNRPLLQTEDPRARLEQLAEARDPLYREVADMILDTDGKSAGSVVEEIIRYINQV